MLPNNLYQSFIILYRYTFDRVFSQSLGWAIRFICMGCLCISQCLLAQPSTSVIAAKVEKRIISDRIEALGTLKAKESVRLTANVTETITGIHFDDGQRVKAGTLLVEMTSKEEHALLAETRSNVRETKRQYNRVVELTKTNVASESLLDERKRDFDTAKARFAATQSRLSDRIVIAPFDGVLGLKNISVGTLVSPGDLITTLNDDSAMKLDFNVPAIFLSSLKIGLKIEVKSDIYASRIFAGAITSIDNQIDPVTRTILVRAILPNEEYLLKQGMLMYVNLLINQRESLIIPEDAIISEKNNTYVMLIENNNGKSIATKTKVNVISRRYGEVEVDEGVIAGQHVVIHGAMKLRSGSAISIKDFKNEHNNISDIIYSGSQ